MKTPREKAKELVNRFDVDTIYVMTKPQAKQCALITVDEIISSIPYGFYSGIRPKYKGTDLEYWQEVKTEIKNLNN